MADGLFTVLLFSIVMAIASFAAGMLPLAISLSQSQIRLLSTIGMGVLVGTSLIVIIPEGIDALYTVPAVSTVSTAPGGLKLHSPRSLDTAIIWERAVIPEAAVAAPSTSIPAAITNPTHSEHGDGDDDGEDSDSDLEDDHKHHSAEASSPHGYVGLALIAGFILMYLIDVIPSHTTPSSPEPYHISIDNLRSISPVSGGAPPKAGSLTLGLVIHAAADGIALGASSTSSNVALGAIIFLAIMLHKAPAAFGLTAVLLRSGIGKRQARAHLIVFSLAAPAGAILTWLLIVMLGGAAASMQWWTGILLLFSGGTFLYVAMHTMQHVAAENEVAGQKGSMMDVVAAVFGMVLPLLTQVGHHHH